ncbi:hypothetical protein O181_027819 [Austropuccinia psidii MF-1]|uniref:Uncharacterized protein n=1 Tax=Austropuccinia psidii MF-1 TaxID=1389203 RepID=A0A9Q3CPM5_9BASI|nr:hypothetical protein [Austropuccinia psidii MF-1]
MWIPGLEKLFNAHNTYNSQTDPKVISDICHGTIWNTVKSFPRRKQAFTNRTGHKRCSEASRPKSDQTEKSDRASNSRYSLRSQTTTFPVLNFLPFIHDSDLLVPSDLSSDENEYLNSMGDEIPIVKKDKLESIWFQKTSDAQSSRVANLDDIVFTFGTWTLWSSQIPHREERLKCPGNYLHKNILLKLLTSLVTLTNMLFRTTIIEEDLDKIERTTKLYCQTLCLGWSMINSKPNLHLKQHLSKVIKELGPPRTLALWAYKRMNCTFGDIPQTNKPC